MLDDKNKHISFWTSSSFIIASMVGTGVFTSLGYQLLNIESTFPLLFLWIIGGFLALCGALTYAELATIFPRSGGEYSLLSNIIHPSVGFCAGLISATIGFAAPSVLASFAFANYLSTIFDFTNVKLISIIVIFIFHIIHISSIKVGTSFQDISTFIKILFILIFILIGLNIENPQNFLGFWALLFTSPHVLKLAQSHKCSRDMCPIDTWSFRVSRSGRFITFYNGKHVIF